MNKRLVGLVILVCAVGGFIWLSSSATESQPVVSPNPNRFRTVHVGSATLNVEVADDVAEITKGLGFRDELGSDGMLFLMPTRGIPSFWMKGMRFPLDFVWIDGDTVVDLTPNVPHEPGVADSELKTYSPKVAVDKVLELPAGDVAKRGIGIGDSVQLQ